MLIYTMMSKLITFEGILGSQFDEKLREITEINKQIAECFQNLYSVTWPSFYYEKNNQID